MKLIFEKRFEKDLKKIQDKRILEKVKSIIEKISLTDSLLELDENVKRMRSNPNFWRIKIRDYRIGLEKEKDKIIFVRILHRRIFINIFHKLKSSNKLLHLTAISLACLSADRRFIAAA